MVKVKNPFVEALQNIAERQDIGSFKKIFDYFGPRLKSFLMKSRTKTIIKEFQLDNTILYSRGMKRSGEFFRNNTKNKSN